MIIKIYLVKVVDNFEGLSREELHFNSDKQSGDNESENEDEAIISRYKKPATREKVSVLTLMFIWPSCWS